MLEKFKAKRLYNALLADMNEMKEVCKKNNYEFDNRGSITIPRVPNKKEIECLRELCEADGFSLHVQSFQWSTDYTEQTTMITITKNDAKTKRLRRG